MIVSESLMHEDDDDDAPVCSEWVALSTRCQLTHERLTDPARGEDWNS